MSLLDIMTSPWAITPEKLLEIRAVYETHLRGEKIDLAGFEARMGAPMQRKEQGYQVLDGGVAVVPVDGVIAKKMNLFSRISGGASTQMIERDVREAVNDPMVRAIILDTDSPGGTVSGTQEAARAIHEMAQATDKPVVAFASGMMASAAYWIGAAADQIFVASDTTAVGSIGVVATHVDVSGVESKQGIKTTEIYSGRYKRIASQHGPLTDEGRASMQATTDYLYSVFVADVATFLGVSQDRVLSDMADGRVFLGRQALDAGLVHGMMSFEQLVNALASGEMTRRRKVVGAGAALTVGEKERLVAVLENELGEKALEVEAVDKETLAKEHPEIAEAFRAEGAAAELKRVQDVFAQTLPGHDALIRELAFDGKTSGEMAAVAVLNAERGKRTKVIESLASEAPAPMLPNAAEPAGEKPTIDPNAPLEDRCVAEWASDAKLRTEFDSCDAYTAFQRATESGRARILRK